MNLATLLRQAANPATLSDDQLTAALEATFGEFDSIAASAAPSIDDLGHMDQLAHAASALRREMDRRQSGPHMAERQAAAVAKMGAVRRGMVASATVAPRAGRMTANRGPARPSPEAASSSRVGPTLVAAAGLRDIVRGTPIEDRMVLAAAVADVLGGLDRTAPPSGDHVIAPRPRYGWEAHTGHVIASAKWADQYPEDRRLGRDPIDNAERISAVCAPHAVIASGGICSPVNVDYSVPVWAGSTRPLRDGLPAFQADRGGLRFVSPPDIGVPSLQDTPPSGLGAATGVWTEATDSTPAGAVKPVYQVRCGEEQEVYVNAIPTRLQFGNMMGRFAPELIAANTDDALAAAAREAELELLTLMYGASKQIKAPATPYLGACRDILSAADLLATKYRYSHRIPESTVLTAVFPGWARSMMRSDLTRELAHDNTDGRDVMAMADDVIDEWFAVRGINTVWTLDGLKAGTYGTGGSALKNQFFALAGTSATTAAWPNATSGKVQVGWLLFAEGSYQFLDGGRLTLGVVRDSTLDATNDYETFVETFEGIAFRGVEAYQVQSTVKPTGGSAGTVTSGSYHE